MISKPENPAAELRAKILLEARALEEIIEAKKALEKADETSQKTLMPHLSSLKKYLKTTRDEVISLSEKIVLNSPLQSQTGQKQLPYINLQQTQTAQIPDFLQKEKNNSKTYNPALDKEERETASLEKETMKRLKRKEEKVVEKEHQKTSKYVSLASRRFGKLSKRLIDLGYFKTLEKDLIRANMEYIPSGYLSITLYTTMISLLASAVIFLFFLFFSLSVELPIITLAEEGISSRIFKILWILFVIPIGTFVMMYYYPSLEKKSEEQKINRELPFATIHMSAISGAMIDPSKIFQIIIATGEYPAISREFTKLLNQITIYGYDLVGALRNMAFNSPSRKLSDMFNSLATAITSGGDLPEFFEKRASSLLFEHRLDEEKQSKAAETFMDIYISVVIAAPMILMLLLMMLKIGGLGISLSTGTITLIMILGVVVINIFFLTFLHLKQPGE